MRMRPRSNLRLLLAVVVIFFVALNVLRTRGRIKRMLIAISTVGGLVILLALAQDISGTPKIYWTIVKPIPLAVSGPFVGHNDFPLFANLSIGAAVSLLMLMRRRRSPSRTARDVRACALPRSAPRCGHRAGCLCCSSVTESKRHAGAGRGIVLHLHRCRRSLALGMGSLDDGGVSAGLFRR